MAARGLGPESLIKGVQQEGMDLLGDWALAANRTFAF